MENLKLLGDTLGVELEPESQEVAVGTFWADIVCRNAADGSKVLIENQLEKTNHIHLGQILTYTAGVAAQTIVWVASKFTEEHRAALDWLNEHTTEEISFFGLEVELWRIGGSAPAPKFNVISKPNDWSKNVRQQTATGGDPKTSEEKRLQFEFWSEFKPWLEEHTPLRTQKAGYQHWLNVALGKAGFHLSAIASYWNTPANKWMTPEIRVDLNLTSSHAKEHFAYLKSMDATLLSQIDSPLTWHSTGQNKSCRIYVRRDCDFRDRASWEDAFNWLCKYLQLFSNIFRPIVSEL
ncbi:MAG: DUF4268 domain-containing protein [Chthoniobacterales bacterium]